MVIKASSGISTWPTSPTSPTSPVSGVDILRDLAKTAGKVPQPAAGKRLVADKPARPEIFVFDGFDTASIDVNGDGYGDVGHGDVVAAIITGRTGIQPTKIQRIEHFDGSEIKKALDTLLERKDVSNLYLNFSINTGADTAVYERLYRLAQRGAHIYIAAGNTSANSLAVAGPPHSNIHIVGASSGIVGSTVTSRDLATFRTPGITEIVNGTISPSNVQNGVDITSDGKADIASRVIPNNAAG